jgi:hypothetical protein
MGYRFYVSTLRTNDDNTSRHGKYDYEQYGINKIEQQRIQGNENGDGQR